MKTLELEITRRYNCPNYCIGTMRVNNVVTSDTLEDTDRGLTSDMSSLAIKVKKIFGKTAIPKGRYKVVLTISSKFKDRPWAKKYEGLVPEILNVKGFSGVRIHPGNKPEDTDGCPLVGENKVKGQIINSVTTYYNLMDRYIMPAYNNVDEIYITIK
jgi:hypothetical protein